MRDMLFHVLITLSPLAFSSANTQDKNYNITLSAIQGQIDDLKVDIQTAEDDVIDNGIDISYVKGVVALNQVDIEKHATCINELKRNLTEIFNEFNRINVNFPFVTELIQAQGFECIGDTVVTIPGHITSANYPDNYPSMYSPPLICTFTLVPNPGMSVHLEWVYFKVI